MYLCMYVCCIAFFGSYFLDRSLALTLFFESVSFVHRIEATQLNLFNLFWLLMLYYFLENET